SWHISHIVSRGRRSMSDEEHNRILEEFETLFLEPLTRGSAMRSEIIPVRIRIEDYLSPEAGHRLREFSSAANRAELQANDRSSWQAFILQAHLDKALLDTETLEEWLEVEGWPQ